MCILINIMNMNSIRSRSTKIYSDSTYNIPISNDRCHQAFQTDKIEVQRVVQQKKQIDKIMHGIIKQRLFGNFINDQTRLSDQNYTNIQQLCRQTTNKRVKPRIKSLNRTIQTTVPGRRQQRTEFNTLDIGKTASFFRQSTKWRSKRTNKLEMSKLPSLEMDLNTKLSTKLSIGYDRINTMKSIKVDKNYHLPHHKKLVINQKLLIQFIRKWIGANSNQLIYDVKLTRQLIYAKLKQRVGQKYLEKFFFFFGFPNTFGLKQYISLIDNAANTSLKFIQFWAFILIDQNNNGIITMQELFKFMQKFGQSAYIEEQIYNLARWLDKNSKRQQQGEGPPQQMLAANRNLRLQQLKQILKQTTKEIIDVNCVKNTCYHQTIWSLQHEYQERVKMSHIENNKQATQKMKSKMQERKKRLQNQPGLRLRDFYTIFGSRRPKLFCYFIYLLINIRPHDYQ